MIVKTPAFLEALGKRVFGDGQKKLGDPLNTINFLWRQTDWLIVQKGNCILRPVLSCHYVSTGKSNFSYVAYLGTHDMQVHCQAVKRSNYSVPPITTCPRLDFRHTLFKSYQLLPEEEMLLQIHLTSRRHFWRKTTHDDKESLFDESQENSASMMNYLEYVAERVQHAKKHMHLGERDKNEIHVTLHEPIRSLHIPLHVELQYRFNIYAFTEDWLDIVFSVRSLRDTAAINGSFHWRQLEKISDNNGKVLYQFSGSFEDFHSRMNDFALLLHHGFLNIRNLQKQTKIQVTFEQPAPLVMYLGLPWWEIFQHIVYFTRIWRPLEYGEMAQMLTYSVWKEMVKVFVDSSNWEGSLRLTNREPGHALAIWRNFYWESIKENSEKDVFTSSELKLNIDDLENNTDTRVNLYLITHKDCSFKDANTFYNIGNAIPMPKGLGFTTRYLFTTKMTPAKQMSHHQYFFVFPPLLPTSMMFRASWIEAHKWCTSSIFGYHLPVIHSREEQDEIIRILKDESHFPITLLFMGLARKQVKSSQA